MWENAHFTRFTVFSVRETVHRAVDSILNTVSSSNRNVLAYGYEKRRATLGGVEGAHRIDCFYPNTTQNLLLSGEWEHFIGATSDEFLYALLLNAGLYAILRNGCCVQLAGPPAVDIHVSKDGLLRLQPSDRSFASRLFVGESTATSLEASSNTLKRSTSNVGGALHSTKKPKLPRKLFRRADLPKVNMQKVLTRRKMLYSEQTGSFHGFHKAHPLLKIPASEDGAIQLLGLLLQSPQLLSQSENGRLRKKALPKVALPLISLLESMLRRTKRASYHRMLEKCCPLRLGLTQPLALAGERRAQSSISLLGSNSNSSSWRRPSFCHSQEEDVSWSALDREETPRPLSTGRVNSAGTPPLEVEKDTVKVDEEIEIEIKEEGSGSPLLFGPPPKVRKRRHPSTEGEGETLLLQKRPRMVKNSTILLQRLMSVPVQVLVQQTVAPSQVAAFVWQVLTALLPGALLGSKHNWSIFYDLVRFFILRGKHETLRVCDIVKGLRLGDLPWCAARGSPQQHGSQRDLLAILLNWMIEEVVIPLVKCHFYVTEANTASLQLVYYRLPVWVAICRLSEATFRGVAHPTSVPDLKVRLALVSKKTLRQLELSTECKLPVASLRFVPKKKGVRAIANLAKRTLEKRPDGRIKDLGSINTTLTPLFHTLKHIIKENPSLVGSSVFSAAEIHSRLVSFIGKQPEKTRFYLASVDIKNAYDNANLEKLFSILKDLIPEEEEYLLVRFNTVLCDLGKVNRRYRRMAVPDEPLQFPDLAFGLAGEYYNCIFTDQVVYQVADSNVMLKYIEQHVFHHRLKLSSRVYEQRQGIPQGSILSTLLISLLYAHMEKHALGPQMPVGWEQRGLLLRMVDDFIFISTSERDASAFIRIMSHGFPDYGCWLNEAKSVVSFKGSRSACRVEKRCISWCGLLFDVNQFSVHADYSKYFEQCVRSTVTMEASQPGRSLLSKSKTFFRLRLLASLVDVRLGSEVSVVQNILQACMLAAMKCQGMAVGLPVRSSDFLTKAVKEIVDYAVIFVRRLVKKHRVPDVGALKPVCIWALCTHAFYVVFIKRKGAFFALCKWLELKERQAGKLVLDLVGSEETLRQMEFSLLDRITV